MFLGSNKNTTVSPLTENSDAISFQIANLQGQGSRARQEDSFALANALDENVYKVKGLLFEVCDGMGGMKDGFLASSTAVKSIRNSFMEFDVNEDIGQQLKNALLKASGEVLNVIGGDGGSTAVACVILHEKLYFASAGDSFLFIFRDNKLIRLNAEHNMCHTRYLEKIREGNLTLEDCRNDPEAVALTSFLGMDGQLTVDYSFRPIPLKKGDVIMSCSDGVGGVLTESELIQALDCGSVHQMSNNVDLLIRQHNVPNQDNYTALFVQCI